MPTAPSSPICPTATGRYLRSGSVHEGRLAHATPTVGCGCKCGGHVHSITGELIANAHVEIWQADEEGFYDVQREGLSEAQNRGQLNADENGVFSFWTVKPEPYSIPYDSPVGEMLNAANRSPMRPAHIHFRVSAPGYKSVITHVLEKGDKYLDSDAVFGVKDSLIADFVRHESGTASRFWKRARTRTAGTW